MSKRPSKHRPTPRLCGSAPWLCPVTHQPGQRPAQAQPPIFCVVFTLKLDGVGPRPPHL